MAVKRISEWLKWEVTLYTLQFFFFVTKELQSATTDPWIPSEAQLSGPQWFYSPNPPVF